MGNNFQEQLELSQSQYIADQMDAYYRRVYGEDCIIKRYEKDKTAQFDYKVDVIVTEKNNTKHFIDEKIKTHQYANTPYFAIELWSNKQRNKRGWIYSSGSQEIVFITLDSNNNVTNVLTFLNGVPLQILANRIAKKHPELVKLANNTYYHTEFVLIHYSILRKLHTNTTILDDTYLHSFEVEHGR